MRNEAGRLEKEVQTLQVEVIELKAEADRLQKGHRDLTAFADNQGINANEILDLIQENKGILAEMQVRGCTKQKWFN